jgi:hypothetical protein
MATTSTGRDEGQRRRLPRLLPPDPVGGSSDETPRTVLSDDSARQRRRTQQKLARQQTPNGRETVSPPAVKDVISFYSNYFSLKSFLKLLASFTTSTRSI